MKKPQVAIFTTMTILLLAAACLWLFSGGGLAGPDTGSVIAFKEGGETVSEADLGFIRGFDSATFKATIRSSGQKPAEAEYTGVLLMDLLDGMGISLDGKKQVTVKGADGYAWAISVSEFDEKDIYIAYKMNGELLKPKIKNGDGPFQLVIPGDYFSQRWCKYVCEVEVK
ncbi:MAG: molybdopterin-dependent oxidoreductase [Clostridiales bacterium]|nr:molybdopterin-dependent oxidoreductase [Clostridiales bacterium]